MTKIEITDGKGKEYYSDGKIAYIGEFKDGKRNGKGIHYRTDGKIAYIGSFKDGNYEGFGRKNYSKSLTYIGEFVKGLPNGECSIFINDKLVYKGANRNLVQSGYGKKYDIEKGVIQYDGMFKSGHYEGEGTLYNNGVAYQRGNFVKDVLEGEGMERYPEGILRYKGEFKNGKWNGWGIVYDKKGKVRFEGNFKDCKYIGRKKDKLFKQ